MYLIHVTSISWIIVLCYISSPTFFFFNFNNRNVISTQFLSCSSYNCYYILENSSHLFFHVLLRVENSLAQTFNPWSKAHSTCRHYFSNNKIDIFIVWYKLNHHNTLWIKKVKIKSTMPFKCYEWDSMYLLLHYNCPISFFS